jgi:hypothetical protein
MPNPNLNFNKPSHEVWLEDLSDTGQRFGLKVEGGFGGITEISQQPNAFLLTSDGTNYGKADPTFKEESQSTWVGGRGSSRFSDDPTRYFDGKFADSRIPNRVFPWSKWKLTSGLRAGNFYDGNNFIYKPLYTNATAGHTRYISNTFTASSSYTAKAAYIMVRKRGNPGTLTLEICENSSGSPGTVLLTMTKARTDVTGEESYRLSFADGTGTGLTISTAYHVKVYGASTDNATNHWEVAVDTAASAAKTSTNNSTWTAAAFTLHYYVAEANSNVKIIPYTFWGYNRTAITQPETGNSKAKVFDAATLTWSDVSLTGASLTGIVKSVASTSSYIYLCFGTATGDNKIATISYGNVLAYDAGTGNDNKADFLLIANHPSAGRQLYWAKNDAAAGNKNCICRATPPQGGDYWLGTDKVIPLPGGCGPVLGMAEYAGSVWVKTFNMLINITNNDQAVVVKPMGAAFESVVFSPMCPDDTTLYFQWLYSLKVFQNANIDDVSLWHEEGLPGDRQGTVSCLNNADDGIYCGLAASGYSSAFYFDGRGYHEMFRGYEAGAVVNNVWLMPQQGVTAVGRILVNYGNDVWVSDLPDNSRNPLNDSDSIYEPEFVLISSTIDFGAMQLDKFFASIDILADNLGQSTYLIVDYQVDNDIGTDNWIPPYGGNGLCTNSPVSRVYLMLGEKKKLRYRIRGITEVGSVPPVVNAVVVSGVAVTAVKAQWNFSVSSSDYQRDLLGKKDHSPVELYHWLKERSRKAKVVKMWSSVISMDNIYVLILPPQFRVISYNSRDKKLSGVIDVSILEAVDFDPDGTYGY